MLQFGAFGIIKKDNNVYFDIKLIILQYDSEYAFQEYYLK